MDTRSFFIRLLDQVTERCSCVHRIYSLSSSKKPFFLQQNKVSTRTRERERERASERESERERERELSQEFSPTRFLTWPSATNLSTIGMQEVRAPPRPRIRTPVGNTIPINPLSPVVCVCLCVCILYVFISRLQSSRPFGFLVQRRAPS